MRVIIAGSRDGVTYLDVRAAMVYFHRLGKTVTEVVSGTAPGTDRLGERWARESSIPIKRFPANWKPNGPDKPTDKAAGHKRNRQMAEYAEALVAIWDGESNGTKGMIEAATKRGLYVLVHTPTKP